MTTPIITPATISLYFVMGETGGAEFLNAPYHCKIAIARRFRTKRSRETLKDFRAQVKRKYPANVAPNVYLNLDASMDLRRILILKKHERLRAVCAQTRPPGSPILTC